MWRYKYKKYKAKQADIIKLVGQSESLAGLSESLAGLSDLGSNLPRLTTWVGRVLLYPALHLCQNGYPVTMYEQSVYELQGVTLGADRLQFQITSKAGN